MSATNLITSTLDYSSLAYAPPPFALVNGDVRRTKGYVVVMRTKLSAEFKLAVAMAGESWRGSGPSAKKLTGGTLIAYDSNEFCEPEQPLLSITGTLRILSRDSAEALFADVCADLRSGGASMRQWCETLPFQVILGKTTRALARKDPPDYTPTIYASGPRWIPTKERPADDTP